MKTEMELIKPRKDNVYTRLFKSSHEGMIMLDHRGRVMAANPSCLKMFGFTEEEIVNRSLQELFPLGHELFSPQHDETEEKNKLALGLHKKGNTFPINISISRGLPGEKYGVIGFLVDASEHIRACQERDQFSKIIDESLNEVCVVHFDTLKILSMNKRTRNHLGYSLDEVTRLAMEDITPSFCASELREKLLPLTLEGHRKISFETSRKRKNGTIYPVEVHIQLTEYFSQKAFMVIAVDITERKSLDQMTMRAKIRGQEKERNRIARRLDLQKGGYMSGIRKRLNGHGLSPSDAQVILRDIKSVLEEGILGTRNVGLFINSNEVRRDGLEGAIVKLCDQFNKESASIITHELRHLDYNYTGTTSFCAYSIVQELIDNAVKHADASEIHLSVERRNQHLVIKLHDNGVGFDMRKMEGYLRECSGIENIITHVRALCGFHSFESEPGKGTSVRVEIPLSC